MDKKYKPVVLIILDGWGYREETKDNAIATANTPFFDHLWQTCPHSLLEASGLAVGLPEGQIGNSEVGHMTIGAGKIIDTDLVRISKTITSGEFKNNPVFEQLFAHAKENNSTLQIMGLVGPGGVHSYQEHLIAFLQAAKEAGVAKIAIHAFLDGRDLPPQSGADYLAELKSELDKLGVGQITTVTGRYFAMDRDNNWNRVELALNAIQKGEGEMIENKKPSEAVREKYALGEVDEHIKPLIFSADHLTKNDSLFIFNFRADRVRMISRKLREQAGEMNWLIGSMTEYEQNSGLLVAFPPVNIESTLAKEVSQAGLTQAHIAETEKFAHATYFLNGGIEQAYPGEEQILIESRKDIATHDQAPEMKAKEIADAAILKIEAGTNLIFINFANADMVGHTANVPAIITAVETLDVQLKRIIEKTNEVRGAVLITADHGNAELNIDPVTGARHTAHTTNPVPCILTTRDKIKDGTLANLAPTVLELMGLPKPAQMENSLLD